MDARQTRCEMIRLTHTYHCTCKIMWHWTWCSVQHLQHKGVCNMMGRVTWCSVQHDGACTMMEHATWWGVQNDGATCNTMERATWCGIQPRCVVSHPTWPLHTCRGVTYGYLWLLMALLCRVPPLIYLSGIANKLGKHILRHCCFTSITEQHPASNV